MGEQYTQTKDVNSIEFLIYKIKTFELYSIYLLCIFSSGQTKFVDKKKSLRCY